MKKHILLLAGILFSSLTFFASAQAVQSDDIVGLWETGSGKARVNIIKSGNYYYGRIVWLKEPLNEEGKPKVDKN
ncbi:MAG: DUF2147 domain-containing protein, partial [Bacteroidota bacterium]|nr:DUF2147 domain-containing protein [Bacteroidota bacterium]